MPSARSAAICDDAVSGWYDLACLQYADSLYPASPQAKRARGEKDESGTPSGDSVSVVADDDSKDASEGGSKDDSKEDAEAASVAESSINSLLQDEIASMKTQSGKKKKHFGRFRPVQSVSPYLQVV